jgi:hypothetical protein
MSDPKQKLAAAKRYCTLCFGQIWFHQLAKEMNDDLVSFLDPGGYLFGNQQFHVCQSAAKSTIPTKESDRIKPEFFSLFQGALDILGFTAGGQRDQQVAGRPEGGDLFGEEFSKGVVVPDGCQETTVSGQGNGRKRPPIGHKAACQFSRQVSTVSGAPAVSTNEDFVSGEQGLAKQVSREGHLGLQVENCPNGRNGII